MLAHVTHFLNLGHYPTFWELADMVKVLESWEADWAEGVA